VLIPDPEAGCSLAESITAADVAALRARYPGRPVVAYVNTTVAVKAAADICCTSGNARAVVESLGAPEVIMLPDEYLARNVARETGVRIIPWRGHCEVHERFTAAEIAALRAAHPGLVVLAHPECPPEVIAAADASGSTADMTAFVRDHKPARVALITECSMGENLARSFPQSEFVRSCTLCPHMRRITLAGIRRALEEMTAEVTIPAPLFAPARAAVERMLAVQ
jgi:quinolinate synthase